MQTDQESLEKYKNKGTSICVLNECNQYSRWIKIDLDYSLHLHDQQNLNHIIHQKQFATFLSETFVKQQRQQRVLLFDQYIKYLNNIIEQSQLLICNLEQQYNNCRQDHQNKINDIFKQNQKSILELNRIEVDKLLNFNINIDQQNTLGYLQSIIKISTGLISQQSKISEDQIGNQVIENQVMKFTNHYTYQMQVNDFLIHIAQISQNQRLLAIAESNRVIIVNLITKKKLGELYQKFVMTLQFSNDSKYLIIGTLYGKVYMTNFRNFNMVYQEYIHANCIRIIKVLNNQILSCSYDKSIALTDISSKRQLFIIKNTHSSYINCLDFDHDNQIVISCSSDKSIKLFRSNGQVVFNQQKAHKEEINQIQLLNNQILMSVSRNELKLWKIDYSKNDFTQIRSLIDETTIYCAQSILKHSMIIKINPKNLSFYDYDLKLIHQTQHADKQTCNYLNISQVFFIKISQIRLTIYFQQDKNMLMSLSEYSDENQLKQIEIYFIKKIRQNYYSLTIWKGNSSDKYIFSINLKRNQYMFYFYNVELF